MFLSCYIDVNILPTLLGNNIQKIIKTANQYIYIVYAEFSIPKNDITAPDKYKNIDNPRRPKHNLRSVFIYII